MILLPNFYKYFIFIFLLKKKFILIRRGGEVAAARVSDLTKGLKSDVDTEGTIYKYLTDAEKERINEYKIISVLGE